MNKPNNYDKKNVNFDIFLNTPVTISKILCLPVNFPFVKWSSYIKKTYTASLSNTPKN